MGDEYEITPDQLLDKQMAAMKDFVLAAEKLYREALQVERIRDAEGMPKSLPGVERSSQELVDFLKANYPDRFSQSILGCLDLIGSSGGPDA